MYNHNLVQTDLFTQKSDRFARKRDTVPEKRDTFPQKQIESHTQLTQRTPPSAQLQLQQ